MYVCLCTSVWVPTEARRGCQIIWSWNYILLWDVQCGCWESNSSLLKEQQAFLTTESSLQLYQLFIFKVSVALCCPRPGLRMTPTAETEHQLQFPSLRLLLIPSLPSCSCVPAPNSGRHPLLNHRHICQKTRWAAQGTSSLSLFSQIQPLGTLLALQ